MVLVMLDVLVNLPNNPLLLIEALGLPFFLGLIVASLVTWHYTESVWRSIVMGLVVGAAASLIGVAFLSLPL
jgi:hypothetical protein